jgi:hypothetical protein
MADKIDTSPSQIATNALQAIPFGSIIGSPLNACIEAQKQSAITSWEFMRDVGMTTDEDGNTKIKYVIFEYRQQGRLATMSIPLLTLVPIPFLAIRDIEIAFKANISASASTSKTDTNSLKTDFGLKTKASYNIGIAKASMEMNMGISSKKDSTATRDSKYSVEYTMDVNVKAGQEDMPAGVSRILEMLNESIDTVDTKGELSITENRVVLEGGNPSGIYATFKNAEGYYDPKAIKITTETGSTVPASKCKLTEDDNGVICMFFEPGNYLVTGGEKKLSITVVKAS